MADIYNDLQRDPPSNEFRNPVSVHFEAPPSDRDLIDHEPALAALIGALTTERAYMDAWLRSYERYRGARTANDVHAMTLQAKAMVEFSSLALQAGQHASHARYLVDVEDAALLDKTKSSSKSLNPSQIERAVSLSADVKLRLEIADMMSRPSNAETLGIDWREQIDTIALISLEHFARELLRQANEWVPRSNTATQETRPALRPGLFGSLRSRAAFTRLHRGPLAAQLQGAGSDSSDFAFGWHASEQVYFAWHQNKDQLLFAAFDPAGKVTLAPQVIGSGRWPRIAGEGQRVAVAWSSPDAHNFVVRLNDGMQWSSETQLTGKEAALAFAPGGPLYGATSTGLWKLSGDHFDRVQEGNYSQPSITVDKDGKPHVAWRQNGRIVYDGSEIGEGERPSVVIAPDGVVNLAYVSKGALVVRSGKGGQWTQPDTIPAKSPSWPTLGLDANGAVRLSYMGAADYGPDALWLVRLSDKQPILMPSLAGNVTDAWFTTEFDLNDMRSDFRPHDLLLTVNDVWVKMFQNTVPEGRYLFRLNPYQVFTSSGQPVPNRVAIHSWHMNPGHYSSISHYRLGVRLAWSEHYVFAANEEEARRSITSEHINHDQPDLGIFANAMNLPIEQPKPGRIDIPLMIANLGEATSSPVRLLMLGERGKVLGGAQVPPLKPGADTTITMPFDYDGKLAELSFRLESNHDFDPSNDSLTLKLWRPKPTGYEGPQPGLPKVPLELTVKLFNENTPASSYRIVQAFSDRMISKVVNGEQFGPLPSGIYRVAVQQYPNEGQEVLFTDNIQHQAGVPQTVQFSSGIILDSQLAGKVGQWSAADASIPERVIQWQSGQHPLMALPPGEYQLAMQWEGQRVVRPEKIQVQPGQQTVVRARAGSLMVSGTGQEHYHVFDSSGSIALTSNRPTNSVTELLPGTYTVKLNNSQQRVEIIPGQQAVVRAGTLMVSGTGQGVYHVFDSSGSIALTSNRPTNSATELLPGTYTVKLNNSQQRVEIIPGQQAVVRAGTLMVSGTGQEVYHVFDSTGSIALASNRPTNSVTELLPGTYTVKLNNSQQRVEVIPGQQAVVRAGTLMVSGTGQEVYHVFDSSGSIGLASNRPMNSVTELLPGTYVIKTGGRTFTVSIKPGERANMNP